MEAIAKHDFTATANDELSFGRNDKLKVKADAEAITPIRYMRMWGALGQFLRARLQECCGKRYIKRVAGVSSENR